MEILKYFLIGSVLFTLAIIYFRIAKKFKIIDIPNHRSAHQQVTMRGIGIIFPLALILYFISHDLQYPFFFAGLMVISTISFLDDMKPLSNRYRIVAQFTSVVLLAFELSPNFQYNYFIFGILLVIAVGIINAYNFMDGINGITGAFSLITIATLYFLNQQLITFVDKELLIFTGISLVVFLFFNFRKQAVGFGGDVGSVSMAFIILFGISLLIFKSGEWKYILLLSVYGIDTVYTLLYRILRRQNIFEAHKLHFFQILVHEYNWPHLWVSTAYALVQLSLNIFIISLASSTTYVLIIPIVMILVLVHMFRSQKGLGLLNPLITEK